ncbi:MAG TPA: SRPBCC family protein [Solirubrobacterales bacterium]|nr:SRPBCC family protein [Solirubrobacterales bacterium]
MLGLGTVTIDAPPTAVWSLIARPGRWHEWSPYVTGAEGLGEPEVEAGAVGAVLLPGGLRVGAEILEVVPGRSWAWRVKGLVIRHAVEPVHGGTRLSMTPEGDGPLWAPLALAYRLPTALIARNVARVAQRD